MFDSRSIHVRHSSVISVRLMRMKIVRCKNRIEPTWLVKTFCENTLQRLVVGLCAGGRKDLNLLVSIQSAAVALSLAAVFATV
jgi:hypothetical protein